MLSGVFAFISHYLDRHFQRIARPPITKKTYHEGVNDCMFFCCCSILTKCGKVSVRIWVIMIWIGPGKRIFLAFWLSYFAKTKWLEMGVLRSFCVVVWKLWFSLCNCGTNCVCWIATLQLHQHLVRGVSVFFLCPQQVRLGGSMEENNKSRSANSDTQIYLTPT